MRKWVRGMNKIKELNISLAAVAKLLIGATAIIHMIFTYIHTNALLLLVNEICGFIMFLFVLAGLVALFEATQIKKEVRRETVMMKVITALISFLTTFLGKLLLDIYRDAIANQPGLVTANVEKASDFTVVMMTAFTVAGVLLLIDAVITFRRTKNERKEDF